MSDLHSYSKVWALGHPQLEGLTEEPVLVQEKLDGCVYWSTPILTSDLRWVTARYLRPGDKLLAFTDELVGTKLAEATTICWAVKRVRYTSSAQYVQPGYSGKWT